MWRGRGSEGWGGVRCGGWMGCERGVGEGGRRVLTMGGSEFVVGVRWGVKMVCSLACSGVLRWYVVGV